MSRFSTWTIVAVPVLLGLAVVAAVILSSGRYETTAIVTPGIKTLLEMRESATFKEGLAWEMGSGGRAVQEDFAGRITLVPLSLQDRTAIYVTGPSEAETMRLMDAVLRQMTISFKPSARQQAAINSEFRRIESILPRYRQAVDREFGTYDGVTRAIRRGDAVDTNTVFTAVEAISYWIDLAVNVEFMSTYRSSVASDLAGFDSSNIVQKPSSPQWRRSFDAAITFGSVTALIAFLAVLYGRSFGRASLRHARAIEYQMGES